MNPKTILYIAISEDGFIAGEDNNLDFLNPYQGGEEDYGYSEFINSVGCILVGRKTYDVVVNMGYPYHPEKMVYVVTRQSRTSSSEKLLFFDGNLRKLINEIKSSQNLNIYCDGGAELTQSLIAADLIDEMILSVVPIQLHHGTLLFQGGMVPNQFSLRSKQTYPNGLVQSLYVFKRGFLSKYKGEVVVGLLVFLMLLLKSFWAD
jgi:dihydrofolate reductase